MIARQYSRELCTVGFYCTRSLEPWPMCATWRRVPHTRWCLASRSKASRSRSRSSLGKCRISSTIDFHSAGSMYPSALVSYLRDGVHTRAAHDNPDVIVVPHAHDRCYQCTPLSHRHETLNMFSGVSTHCLPVSGVHWCPCPVGQCECISTAHTHGHSYQTIFAIA